MMLFFVCVPAVIAGIILAVRLRRHRQVPVPASGPGNLSPDWELTEIDRFLYEKCCRYMVERRPFLVESFTIEDLSMALCTNRNYLSKAINGFSGRNFRQYVNYYRVTYSMEIFRRNMGLKVSELSMLSGFNNQVTFNHAFKTVMEETPGSWCTRMRENILLSP